MTNDMIKLKGLRILFAGSFRDFTRDSAETAASQKGGLYFYGKKPFDVAVVGRRPAKKDMELIEGSGKPQLDEEQFKLLLQFGELDLNAGEVQEEQPMGDAIGELRGLLDGEPSPQMWRDIVTVIDRTEPERLSEVLAYVEGHVSRWPIDEERRWHSSMIEATLLDSNSWVCGDLRVMPKHWLEELFEGKDSEKFALVRGISLEGMNAKTRAASKIFDSQYLFNVRHFDCGRDSRINATFFKKMVKCKQLNQLESLIYYPNKDGSGKVLAEGKHFSALKHLKLRWTDLSFDRERTVEDIQDLFCADWIGQIESLESVMNRTAKVVRMYTPVLSEEVLGEYGHRLTGLKRLVEGGSMVGRSTEHLHDVFRRIEVLGLAGYNGKREDAYNMLDLFASIEDKALHTIDLSQLMTLPKERSASAQNPLIGKFVKHPVAKQIKTVCVSKYASKKTLDTLGKLEGVEVRVL